MFKYAVVYCFFWSVETIYICIYKEVFVFVIFFSEARLIFRLRSNLLRRF